MDVPYVVLIGNVGAGKSSLVEKISGSKNLSSDQDTSATRVSTCFPSSDNSLFISDTPGKNPMDEIFSHNLNIAYAMNLKPVSRILIVVKADTRMDQTLSELRKYIYELMDFEEHLSVCVTHMDVVKWDENKFRPILENKLGIDAAIYSGGDTDGKVLTDQILSVCTKEPLEIKINKENFLKYFNISDENDMAIIKSIRKEVNEMKEVKDEFFKVFRSCDESVKADMIFEFQAWVRQEIIEAQKRISTKHNFWLSDDNWIKEAGHIGSLTNQLKGLLFDVRKMLPMYQLQHGISMARKCPHCHKVWTKIYGCDGPTECGARLDSSARFDTKLDSDKQKTKNVFAKFTFNRLGKQLNIVKTTKDLFKIVSGNQTVSGYGAGCGRKIIWMEMQSVELPSELCLESKQKPHTDDVNYLLDEVDVKFKEELEDNLKALGSGKLKDQGMDKPDN